MNRKRELQRDVKRGKLAGVCAGLAAHFGWELWLVRIIFVSGMLLTGVSFFLVAYVIAWVVLEKKPNHETTQQHAKHWRDKTAQSEQTKNNRDAWREEELRENKVEVKSRVWQAGEPPLTAFNDIERSFDSLENRLRKMESYVTSSEFQLNREFKKL